MRTMQQRVLHILVLFRDDTDYFVSECVEISTVFLFKNFFFPDIGFLLININLYLLGLLVTKGQLGKLLCNFMRSHNFSFSFQSLL